jgi:hypothetical protein
MANFHQSPTVALIAAVLLAVVATSSNARGDDLRSLRNGVRNEKPKDDNDDDRPAKKKKKKERSHDDDHHHHAHAHNHDDDGLEIGSIVVTGIVTSPYWIPAVALGDDYELAAWFPDAPYEGVAGALVIDSPLPENSSDWIARLRGEYSNDFDNLNRAGSSLLLEHSSRFGIDTSWDYRYQDLLVGHDDLWTGDFNIVYRFAQSERVQFRSGLGFNWLSDEIDTDFGFNFTYGADFFPAEPWVVSAVIDWGRLGNASLFHGRVTVGVVLDRFEIYTGYDYYDVGGTPLEGFIAGVGVWLN